MKYYDPDVWSRQKQRTKQITYWFKGDAIVLDNGKYCAKNNNKISSSDLYPILRFWHWMWLFCFDIAHYWSVIVLFWYWSLLICDCFVLILIIIDLLWSDNLVCLPCWFALKACYLDIPWLGPSSSASTIHYTLYPLYTHTINLLHTSSLQAP